MGSGFQVHHGIPAATAKGCSEAGEKRTDQQRHEGPQRGVGSHFCSRVGSLLGFQLGVIQGFLSLAIDLVNTRLGIGLAEVGALADQLCKVRTVFWCQLAVVAHGASEDAGDHTVHGVIADGCRAVITEQAVDVVAEVFALGGSASHLAHAAGGTRCHTGTGLHTTADHTADRTDDEHRRHQCRHGPGQEAMGGVAEGIIKGMYLLEEDTKEAAHHVQLMGSGTILREVREAAKILREEFNIGADVWSVTSFNELRRDGLAVERSNRLHPGQKPQLSYVEECLSGRKGPVIASTDYMKLFAEQIRQWVPSKEFKVLGTDGFGRSDSRKKLRHFFEVDRHFVVLAALEALADRGDIEPKVVAEAIVKFGINPEKRNPLDC